MGLLTFALFFVGIGAAGPRRINRTEGFILLCVYFSYSGYLIAKVVGLV